MVGTETSTSSLLLTALSALLSHSHDPRAYFATRLPYPWRGAVPWSTSGTSGSREATTPLSPSQVALWWDVPRHTWACSDAVRFRRAVSFNQSCSHNPRRTDAPSSACKHREQPLSTRCNRRDTALHPSPDGSENTAFASGNLMDRFKQEMYGLLAQTLTSPHSLLGVSL